MYFIYPNKKAPIPSKIPFMLALTGLLSVAWMVPGPPNNPSAAEEPQVKPVDQRENHFTIIQTRTKAQPTVGIGLRGQFDDRLAPHNAGPIRYVGIPVAKNREEVRHPQRLQIWRQLLQDKQPQRRVHYRDQFGEREITIGDGSWLIVPANGSIAEGLHTEEVSGQHYKAYRVIRGSSVRQNVQVVDVLGQGNVTLGSPVYFCVPVTKEHNRNQSKILHPEVHLIIYNLSPNRNFDNKEVLLKDQFSEVQLELQRAWFLAVPAAKLEWGVVED